MAKLSRDLATPPGGVPVLNPREALMATGLLGSVNAEIVCAADSSGVCVIDLRGTFNMTVEVSGTVDGTNWILIPVRPRTGSIYVAAVAGAVAGQWIGDCAGYRAIRARVTAYTSGSAVATLAAHALAFGDAMASSATPQIVTAVGAAGAAVTLTLAAPGAGLRHYLTYLSINRFATAALTAAAAPVTITTTNLPGALAFSFEADAAQQGTIVRWREDFAYPVVALAQNTATTIVMPVTTGVIWRATAGWYVAP